MSFSHTTPQMRARTKTVTRRLGWWFLKRDDVVMAIEKGQGLKKGEKVRRITPIRIISTRAERLDEIDALECEREGMGWKTPPQFVDDFCASHRCVCPGTVINRIEFVFV